MKNWKSLFVKTEVEEEKNTSVPLPENFSFPVNTSSQQPTDTRNINTAAISEAVNEVLTVYEKGVDSINMPGYDFYEFYKAINTIPAASEQAYHMAFQMARSMDATITAQKLINDADFYISKINEVHSQYNMQGEQKINTLTSKKEDEKKKLSQEIDHALQQVNQLRNQLQVLENEINQKRLRVTSIEGEFLPQENAIRQKLMANDSARQISVLKLNTVKEGIQKHVK